MTAQPRTSHSTSQRAATANLGLDLLWLLAGSTIGVVAVLLVQRLNGLVLLRPGTVLGREAAAMGLPLDVTTPAYWYLARAGGLVGYLLLWATTFWGILMSSRLARALFPPALVFSLHEFLPLLAVIFTVIHGIALLGDSYVKFIVGNLFIPFTGPYRPGWVGLGVIAAYLNTALILSFYGRRWIGRRAWRLLHFTSYLAFLLVFFHGVMAGSDSGTIGVQGMYFVTGGSILFLTLVRLLTRSTL